MFRYVQHIEAIKVVSSVEKFLEIENIVENSQVMDAKF